MKRSELKQLIREVIQEIAVNEPAVNPSFQDVKVGDIYASIDTFKHQYKSTVLAVEPISNRFSKPDRVVSVKIETLDGTQVIDEKKKIWVSQLLQGLI